MSKNIAIFNSFPFHYEMFGYIIFYCYLSNFSLTIYTEYKNVMGWFIFYNNLFNNSENKYEVKIVHYTNFEKDIQNNSYDLIFLTTDDDPNFEVKWMTDRVVCINHFYVCRRIDWFHCIGTRPFSKNLIKWAIPCVPVFNSYNKVSNYDNEFMHVAVIGGGNSNKSSYDISTVNRLKCNKKIVLHIISRLIKCEFNNIDSNIEIKKYEMIETLQMYNILLKCSYVLTDVDNVMNVHRTGYSMSGSIPIAFSSLTKLIISKKNNTFYKFASVKEFDFESNDNILLEDTTEETLKLIEEERNHLISMFHNNVNNIILQNK